VAGVGNPPPEELAPDPRPRDLPDPRSHAPEDGTLTTDESPFSRQVGDQAVRKLRAKRQGNKSVWFGLGMSGLIGWTITVPTVIGIAIGVWIDNHYNSQYSWTLMLLVMGLCVGCLNACYWVKAEYRAMEEDAHE
jgi:ATP synthase protein I